MNLLIINQHPSDSLGGSEMQCDLIARGLTKRGHHVVYTAVGSKRKEEYPGLPYLVVPLAIEKRGELLRLLGEERPDVIYWRFNKHYLLQAVQESKRASVPFVFAVSHVNDVMKYHKRTPILTSGLLTSVRSLTQIAVRQVTALLNYRAFQHIAAVTTLNSQYVGILPVHKQHVIWNSVSNKAKQFEWEKPYCLWVANIKPAKQPEIFIQLSSIMAKRFPDIDFLMIGAIQSRHYEAILQEAEKLPNFHYLGFQPIEVVNGALQKAVCLLHTCKPEGFGNNFIQAWMQGCPTISLEFDPDDLIQTEKMGFVSGTIEQMADDVETLLRDEKLREEIGNRAQAFAHANFTPRRMVSEIESFLQEVIDEYNDRKD